MAQMPLCAIVDVLKEALIEFDNLTLYFFIANEETQRSLFMYLFIYHLYSRSI